MDIKYEMLSFNAETGGAVIRYWTDAAPQGLICNVDIPIENGAFLKNQALVDYIMHYAPTGQLERMEQIATAVIPPELNVIKPPVTGSEASAAAFAQTQIDVEEREAEMRAAFRQIVIEVIEELKANGQL